jgi:hypothetical protein
MKEKKIKLSTVIYICIIIILILAIVGIYIKYNNEITKQKTNCGISEYKENNNITEQSNIVANNTEKNNINENVSQTNQIEKKDITAIEGNNSEEKEMTDEYADFLNQYFNMRDNNALVIANYKEPNDLLSEDNYRCWKYSIDNNPLYSRTATQEERNIIGGDVSIKISSLENVAEFLNNKVYGNFKASDFTKFKSDKVDGCTFMISDAIWQDVKVITVKTKGDKYIVEVSLNNKEKEVTLIKNGYNYYFYSSVAK